MVHDSPAEAARRHGQSGQALVQYAMVVSLVVMFGLGTLSAVGTHLRAMLSHVPGAVESTTTTTGITTTTPSTSTTAVTTATTSTTTTTTKTTTTKKKKGH